MAVEITIKVDDATDTRIDGAGRATAGNSGYVSREEHDEVVRMLGDDIKPFPSAKVGGYMSHFRILIELMSEPSRVVSIVSPLAAQSVAWGDPFIYEGPEANHGVDLPLPPSSKLPARITEADFIEKPPEFFEKGKETIWLQILNLDARMDSEIGPIRIILGETVKREYPDLFRPSLGAAQSLGKSGFPARLFFNPFAIVETPIGAFRAVHGVLSYGRVTNFPPIGTPVTIRNCIPLDHVDVIRKEDLGLGHSENPMARILALTHPIDMELQLETTRPSRFAHESLSATVDAQAGPGEAAYHFVERMIAAAPRNP